MERTRGRSSCKSRLATSHTRTLPKTKQEQPHFPLHGSLERYVKRKKSSHPTWTPERGRHSLHNGVAQLMGNSNRLGTCSSNVVRLLLMTTVLQNLCPKFNELVSLLDDDWLCQLDSTAQQHLSFRSLSISLTHSYTCDENYKQDTPTT